MMSLYQLLFLLCCLLVTTHVDSNIDVKDLDCRMRVLALDYARRIQSWKNPEDSIFLHIHDALQLSSCPGVPPPRPVSQYLRLSTKRRRRLEELPSFCHQESCIFVDNSGAHKGDGTLTSPIKSLNQALELSRAMSKPLTIVMSEGVHFLDSPLELGPHDSGLKFVGLEGAWLSGGIAIPPTTKWVPLSAHSSILVADLSQLLKGRKLPNVASLFTQSNRRYIRARFPNSDPETNSQTPNKNFPSHPDIIEWTRPPKGEPPVFDFIDFSTNPPPNVPIKNDSTMEGYNVYASGHGGVCADVWGPNADSYWCSNASSGGWAETDKECATSGQLQIPVGLTYNSTDTVIGHRMTQYQNATGGYIFALHTQGWAVHMFEIESHSTASSTMKFAKGGGKQGGRNWQRCGQISPDWCGQKQDPPDNTDVRLLGGNWFIENILEELDQPGEFYFDAETNNLYVIPNGTDTTEFHFALHETLINIQNSNNITISNIGFRDAAATFMSDWSAPSGGDWSLHRGGAIFIEDSCGVTVRKCLFQRLDGNAIFLSRRVRGARILRNSFEWLGEGAVATWGHTKKYDGTEKLFPMDTIVSGNVMRELGIYEKQSSGVGLAKSTTTHISNNIMFNLPRAAVNFNDGMGGGDVMEFNLLFNTCRESGDHGPVNSWDRQPFLTTLRYGVASFTPLMRIIRWNYIFANYGAAQGVDNDDGSSWFHIHHNVWYDSEGFKMDYGGTDSIYEDNLIITYPPRGGQNCIGFGSFYEGHGDTVRRNRFIVHSNDRPSVLLTGCDHMTASLYHNEYYSPNGTVLVECEFNSKNIYTLEDAQQKFGLEAGSVAKKTPEVDEIVAWSRDLLSLTSKSK